MITTIKNKLRDILPESAINNWHLFEGITANFIYGNPSQKMKVIGITGTNGKTTTAHLVSSIFEVAGFKTAMATTIDFKINGKTTKNNQKQTTLNPFKLQKFLKKANQAGVEIAVIEVTSHSLVQHRLHGIKFDTAVFTNLTHDHLDYHKTMTNYRHAKEILFKKASCNLIVNADDPNAHFFLRHKAPNHLAYSVKQIPDSLYRADIPDFNTVVAKKIIAGPRETVFTAVTSEGQFVVTTKLHGTFNISNTLAAVCVGISHNISEKNIKTGIESVSGVSGRMERIDESQPFLTIVDYAHTPDAFEKVYEAVLPLTKKRLICVHGATGSRDTAKRPVLGKISGKYADIIIITNEDPYHENPSEIMQQVVAGVPKGTPKNKPKQIDENIFMIEDRRQAINKALSLANKDDVVLILGKGAEEVMAVGDPAADHGFKLIPWKEKEIVKEELNKLGYKK